MASNEGTIAPAQAPRSVHRQGPVGFLYNAGFGPSHSQRFPVGPKYELRPGMPTAKRLSPPLKPPLFTWFILPILLTGVFGSTWFLVHRSFPKPLASGLPLLVTWLVIDPSNYRRLQGGRNRCLSLQILLLPERRRLNLRRVLAPPGEGGGYQG